MIFPGVIGQQQLLAMGGGGGTLWTPLNMATVPQIYLHAQNSVVTNVSGACSAISNLGAMGANGDFSQATAGNRPTILETALNGKRVLSFNGLNNVLTGGTTAQLDLFRNVGAAWALFVIKKRLTDAGTETRRILHASSSVSGNVRFACHSGANTALNRRLLAVRREDAGVQESLFGPTSFVGAFGIEFFTMDYSTREGAIYINGSLEALNSTLTAAAGNTSNTAAANALSIGARYDGVVPADVDIAAVIISNTQPAAGEREKLEGWAADEFGLTASLPSGHPYKTTPPYV